MIKILIFLKLNLKTLGSLLTLFLLASCVSSRGEFVYYQNSEIEENFLKEEILPDLEPDSSEIKIEVYSLDIKGFNNKIEEMGALPELLYKKEKLTYNTSINLKPRLNEYNLPLLAPTYINDNPDFFNIISSYYEINETSITENTWLLPEVKPVAVEKKRVPVIKPVVKKEEPKVVIKTETEENSKIKTEKAVTVNVEPVKKAIENENITFKDSKSVILGKSFTIEMDQTGWLIEDLTPFVNFENKFYTKDKVLFEFFPNKSGNFNIEFVKYGIKGKELGLVNLMVMEKDDTTKESEEPKVIVPSIVKESISEKERLEREMANIDSSKEPDLVYFKLAEIYYEEGLIKKAKEYYEYVYDNYPFSIFYDKSKEKMNFILENFLKVR